MLAVFAVLVNLLILWRALILLQLVAGQRHQLAALARTDALTGLPNRRSWDFEINRAAVWAETGAAPLSVAILDLDHFHGYNKTYRHQRGDDILRACADAWRSALPPSAYLARYGGEEFAVLLPGADRARADDILDQVRRATPAPLTVSVGHALHDRGQHVLATVAAADAALFAAKSHGRDVVMSGAVDTPRPETVDLRTGP